jgi:hypothetical protein
LVQGSSPWRIIFYIKMIRGLPRDGGNKSPTSSLPKMKYPS